MPEVKNYGVIEGIRDTDWVAGSIPYEVRVPSGNWEPYLPPGEWQRSNLVDTMGCVSFSALNSVEAQLKFLGDERNFSDRFLAMMSGTTKQGNWLWKVADTLRREGAVVEERWPAPENYTWEEYYQPVPIEVINEAKLFLQEYEILYEWIPTDKDSLIKHLKQAPIQVVIPGHAIVNFFTTQQVIHYFDTYVPFKKTTKSISSALKIVVIKKDTSMKKLDWQGRLWVVMDEKRYWVLDPKTRDRLGGAAAFVRGDASKYPYNGAFVIAETDEPK